MGKLLQERKDYEIKSIRSRETKQSNLKLNFLDSFKIFLTYQNDKNSLLFDSKRDHD